MSLYKGATEIKTILDFSNTKHLTKNKVRNALRAAEILEYRQAGDTTFFINNDIQVGMYKIRLLFSSIEAGRTRKHLREYGAFKVIVYELSEEKEIPIKPFKDQRFIGCKHLGNGSYFYHTRIKDLIDIVMHVKKLDKLKVFL